MVKSTCDACTIRQKVLMSSDKNKDLYTILLLKRLGNIVFCVNKTKENQFKAMDHQMGEPACQTTSHAGLFGCLMLQYLKMADRDEARIKINLTDRFLLASLIGQID